MQLFQFKPRHPVVRLAYSADGRFLVTAQPHTAVCVRHVIDGSRVHTVMTPRTARFDDVALDPTGRWLAVIAGFRVQLSDLQNPDKLDSLWPQGLFDCVSFSADGQSLLVGWAAHYGYSIGNLSTPTHPEWQRFLPHPFHAEASCFGFTSDLRFAVAIRLQRNPVLIDLALDTIAAELDFPHPLTWQIAPLPRVITGSDRVAISDGRCVAVYDLSGFVPPAPKTKSKPKLKPIRVLDPPPDVPEGQTWFPPVAFTPDGKAVLTGWERQRVRMWDLESEGVRREWNWHLEEVRSLAVAPDGLTAAAGGRLGKVLVWDLDG